MQTLDYSQIDYTQIKGLKEILTPIVLYVFFQMGRMIWKEIQKYLLKKKGELFSMPEELKKISDALQKHAEKQDEDIIEIKESMLEITLSGLRNEIMRALYHTPGEKQIIEDLYRKYKSANGNFYIDEEIRKWREKQSKQLKPRIRKTSSL